MSAHNGLIARLVEQHGFEGGWTSSLKISASHAVPDANILTASLPFSAHKKATFRRVSSAVSLHSQSTYANCYAWMQAACLPLIRDSFLRTQFCRFRLSISATGRTGSSSK
ncbi:isocitrate lyase/phosphoenolpyruvate mutase family protein [candidate division KSB1 bacterium]|nr:isocitrate lyase/phosphoenolpyruvate mutase family protein [candidate division KSB1 bacterium]